MSKKKKIYKRSYSYIVSSHDCWGVDESYRCNETIEFKTKEGMLKEMDSVNHSRNVEWGDIFIETTKVIKEGKLPSELD